MQQLHIYSISNPGEALYMKKMIEDKQLKLSGKAWQVRHMLRQLRQHAPQDALLQDYLQSHRQRERNR